MNQNYKGSLLGLQNAVLDRERLHRFRSAEGEILHWWPSTGTVVFQGRPGPLQRHLAAALTHLVATNDGVRVIRTRAVIR